MQGGEGHRRASSSPGVAGGGGGGSEGSVQRAERGRGGSKPLDFFFIRFFLIKKRKAENSFPRLFRRDKPLALRVRDKPYGVYILNLIRTEDIFRLLRHTLVT